VESRTRSEVHAGRADPFVGEYVAHDPPALVLVAETVATGTTTSVKWIVDEVSGIRAGISRTRTPAESIGEQDRMPSRLGDSGSVRTSRSTIRAWAYDVRSSVC
jgi:hypothetical protein